MRCLDSITDSMDMNLSKFWEKGTRKPGVLKSMGSQTVEHDLATAHTHKITGTHTHTHTYIYIYIFFFFFQFHKMCMRAIGNSMDYWQKYNILWKKLIVE